jgi:alpha-glucoside transport system permease protein
VSRQAATAGGAAAVAVPPPRRGWGAGPILLLFLGPAVILLAALVIYPTVATLIRSLWSDSGDHFVGLHNYKEMFSLDATRTAIKNNAIWVVVAPTVVTAFGLIFAVLSERIRWATAFKVVVFMPMAISMLASGVIFRLVYQADPEQGLANAVVTGIHDTFAPSSKYTGAIPRQDAGLEERRGAILLSDPVAAGSTAQLPVVGLPPEAVPSDAAAAAAPEAAGSDAVTGTVWLDFQPGGGGTSGEIDGTEHGLPGIKVEALSGTSAVASATTDSSGRFTLSGLDAGESYTVRLAASNFAEPYNGVNWLGPSIVTPAIIGAYIWMWAGFAMVLIAAGLAAIPRDALEAARVDGATEWQVFRRVTVPLLAPVLVVVLVTLIINVLKIFDLVLIIAPGSSQDDATVLALQMWRVSFGAQPLQGLGSALAIFLFLLVIPAMLFNIRRFRREQS